MRSKERKQFDDRLRRNIWRSLLIMRSATVQDLLGVVSGLTTRNAKSLLRDLETHGYLRKEGKTRPLYTHAVHSPSLPPVCAHCGRPFDSKACPPKETQTQRQRERQRQRQTATTERLITPDVEIQEVHHDAA